MAEQSGEQPMQLEPPAGLQEQGQVGRAAARVTHNAWPRLQLTGPVPVAGGGRCCSGSGAS